MNSWLKNVHGECALSARRRDNGALYSQQGASLLKAAKLFREWGLIQSVGRNQERLCFCLLTKPKLGHIFTVSQPHSVIHTNSHHYPLLLRVTPTHPRINVVTRPRAAHQSHTRWRVHTSMHLILLSLANII